MDLKASIKDKEYSFTDANLVSPTVARKKTSFIMPNSSKKHPSTNALQIKIQNASPSLRSGDISISIDDKYGKSLDDDGEKELLRTKLELDETIKDLDVKLNRVLAKQEYEYLRGYNVYVKKKEKDLRDLIFKINEKSQNASYKDEKMRDLQNTVTTIQKDQIKCEKQILDLKETVKTWKGKHDNLQSENKYMEKQITDTKKKNKLLKLAIGKLQSEFERLNQETLQKEQTEKEMAKNQFFITDLLQAVDTTKVNLKLSTSNNPFDTTLQHDYSTLQTSFMENSLELQKARKVHHKRVQSVSRYANIPAENIKFEKFMDLIFNSKMMQQEVKEEIKKFIKALETNYNETIKDLKIQNEKLQKQIKTIKGENINKYIEKSDYEALFVDCIEEVRKEVMKRRIKNEVIARKKIGNLDPAKDEAAKEFEESLLKLANLAKGRVKITEFNSRDRFNLLDLFVNNEKTLIKVYEVLFPHRTTQDGKNGFQSAGVSRKDESDIVEEQSTISMKNDDTYQMFPSIQGKEAGPQFSSKPKQ